MAVALRSVLSRFLDNDIVTPCRLDSILVFGLIGCPMMNKNSFHLWLHLLILINYYRKLKSPLTRC